MVRKTKVFSFHRHFPSLLVCLALFLLPIALSYTLWKHYTLNSWVFAVTAYCLEVCLKVMVSLSVYVLLIVDASYDGHWENLDDYVYYVRSAGNIIQILLGFFMIGNGAYAMMHRVGSKIFAPHNIYLQAKKGWKTFIKRSRAFEKINFLPEIHRDQLKQIDDVCAICYQDFVTSARITPCQHYFHAVCLRKWLYIQDTCPLCHQKVEERSRYKADIANNLGAYAAPQDAAAADPPIPEAAGGVREHNNELLDNID
ncbi:unnamed protein product [Pleuronectes platessa]|uniref:RING-type domain-containing protein n=1 Tax=Pleuronectes platessa TaxID=8262 RepID=A0A9N7YQ52_PLEPL|nr:unnamed protein product [Pleuronectes platessa]